VNTQPLMLVAGVACWRAWREQRRPDARSTSPATAWASTALSSPPSRCAFEDALPLVRFRAQAMQEAVPEGTGGIAAILGLDEGALKEVCEQAAQGEVLEPANLNSPAKW
jgi:[acyl-carrier-protein] S-malonyltransferase